MKNHTNEDSAQRILAHALAGAVIAKAQGKDALAGAAGASTGELTAKLALDLYGKKPEQLGEDERQLVSALSSVAAGLAGAAVSDNTAGVQAAAQAGKNAVENNFLSDTDITTFIEKYAKAKTEAEKAQLRADLNDLDIEKQNQALAIVIPVLEQKNELEKLRQLVASPECGERCRQLAEYSISQLEPVVNDTALHNSNLVKYATAGVIQQLIGGLGIKSGKPTTTRPVGASSTSALDDIVKGESRAGQGAAGAIKSPGSNLPSGYELNGNKITGPRGGVYSSTGKVDSAGNTIYANNGAYYTFDNGAKFKASSPNSGSEIQQNYQKGKEFENSIYDKIKSDPNFNSPAREVTLETSGGTKVRIDIMAKDKLGNIVCVECKSSPVAPLTPNQKKGFPELEKGGGTVIGKGHPGFEEGARIPPTKVDIVRPEIPKK